ncbi:hypothetical protein L6452_06634 [Arctium lappa]|uniref:Uncharacterized protein n=1 Tax=Arctium lappa TaxID=4217 RepID=A0ACB9EK29_ARCLA|nr:hypothetical protein L6452_06634 [Arctium lappa]
MAKRLIPCLNRVLMEKIVPPSKTTTGILLPDKSSKLNSGKVIVVGPGTRDKSGNTILVSVNEGDTALLPEYGGTEVKLGEKHSKTGFDLLGGCEDARNFIGGDFLEQVDGGRSNVIVSSEDYSDGVDD